MNKRGIVAPASPKIAGGAIHSKVVFSAGMMMEGIIFMTAIHYPDIVAWSPSRNFRCEATSPFNLPEWHPGRVVSPTELVWPGAFQEDFEFTLYEGTSDDGRWTLRQAQVSEISPHAIHVSDSGWCVVRTHGPFSAGLVTLSPEGRVVHSVDLLQNVFVGRWSGYVRRTSAGPFWAGTSYSYFVHLDRREHFCARTWWGQRVLLDLERGVLADDAPHAADLAALELAWSLRALETTRAIAAAWSGPRSEVKGASETLEVIQTALAIVSRRCRTDAEAHVRALESCRLLTWSTTCGEAFEARRSGSRSRDSWWIACFGVRALAALALRRLGAVPSGHAAFAIHRRRGDDEVQLDVPERIADRSHRAKQVRPGMPGSELIALLGAPDHAMRDWEYDLDEPPATLRIRWKDGLIDMAESVEPGWRGDSRDHHLLG